MNVDKEERESLSVKLCRYGRKDGQEDSFRAVASLVTSEMVSIFRVGWEGGNSWFT